MKTLKLFLFTLSLLPCFVISIFTQDDALQWTEDFHLDQSQFTATGKNRYFTLQPKHQTVLQGIDETDTTRLTITVLDKTVRIGGIETRIVEEHETVNGKTVEISWNYYAMSTSTQSVYYFGEDVDIYTNGAVTSHKGTWRAGTDGAKPGLMMPGEILIGARYYQEVAPGIAMDRAEIIGVEQVKTSDGKIWKNCLIVRETTPLEKKTEFKWYHQDVGLIRDGDLTMTQK